MTIFHKNLSISHYFTFYNTTFAVDLYKQGKGFMINVNIYYICISSIPTFNNLIKLDPLVRSIRSLLKELTRHTLVTFLSCMIPMYMLRPQLSLDWLNIHVT